MKFPATPILALLALGERAVWLPRPPTMDRWGAEARLAALTVAGAAEQATLAEAPVQPRRLAASQPTVARLRRTALWQLGAPPRRALRLRSEAPRPEAARRPAARRQGAR